MVIEVQVGDVFIFKLVHEGLLRLFVQGGDWDLGHRDYSLAKLCHLRLIILVPSSFHFK